MKTLVSLLAATTLGIASITGVAASEQPRTIDITTGVSQETTLDIVDTAVGAGSFGTLATALEAAGLVDTLKGDGPFTVFAPTDEAFAALPAGTLESLLGDIDALTDILLYHVVAGDVRAADVVMLDSADTVGGSAVNITVGPDGVVLNGDVNVTATDIEASNGVIHVIDAVLLPPAPMQVAAADIVDTAVAAGSFETLAAALGAAGLVDTLKGEGPFTVFAPTDEAFAALPAGTVDALLMDIPALTDILLYHVVSGDVRAADVVTLDAASTVQGSDVTISVRDGMVFLNESVQVVSTDIEASNGVIHVIDAVLLPPAAQTTDVAPADAGDGVLAGDFGSSSGVLAALGALALAAVAVAGGRLATSRRRS